MCWLIGSCSGIIWRILVMLLARRLVRFASNIPVMPIEAESQMIVDPHFF